MLGVRESRTKTFSSSARRNIPTWNDPRHVITLNVRYLWRNNSHNKNKMFQNAKLIRLFLSACFQRLVSAMLELSSMLNLEYFENHGGWIQNISDERTLRKRNEIRWIELGYGWVELNGGCKKNVGDWVHWWFWGGRNRRQGNLDAPEECQKSPNCP